MVETITMRTGSLKVFVTILAAAAGAAAIVLVAGLATTQQASASMKNTQETGKPCTFCHTAPPALTDAGKKFKANGNKL
jgi:hypothetical protein